MDEHQNYERFDVDNDYEGGEWIGGEFFHTGKRQKRSQTKEDVLFGVFQGDSDSDDGGRGRRKRKAADYTKPIGFVSSGIVQSTEEKPEDIDASEHRAGLGASTSSVRSAHKPSSGGGRSDSEEEADADGVLPSAFGRQILEAAEERRRQEQQRSRQKSEKKKQQAAAPGSASDIGQFEKHTKGIGAKLLAKMGYVPGEGLGAKKQGIAKPIEAKLRPKGMGMGFNDYTEHKLLMPGAEAKKPDAEKAPEKAVEVKLWKKRNAEARVKREYRTADEILQEAAERPAMAQAQPILDMRGPQARLVTNLEHLNVVETSEAGDATPMPELQHNLRLLVDLAEADIQRIDGKLRHEKDTAVILGREQARLEQEAAAVQQQVERVTTVLQQVERCQSADSRVSLSELEQAYRTLARDYREEYIMYNLAGAAYAQVLPRLSSLLASWNPLTQPAMGTAEFGAWRRLLESEGQRDAIFQDLGTSSADPYTRLVHAAVLPPLSRVITNEWEPRNPEPLLQVMELWEKLLPAGVLRHVLDTLIFPKLSRAVEAWEPRAETVALHTWLHPWLPSLGSRLEDLYPGIRFKLATALQQWHPSDTTALALLSPWHTVFDAKDWDALMSRSIVPKLAWALQELLVINPLQQDLGPIQWVLAWHQVLPIQHMVALLERHFFPKWHHILHHWLSNSPNYDEVTSWYLGWKTLLPAELLDNDRIRAQLNAALNTMNSAVEGVPIQAYQQPAFAPGDPYGAYGAAGYAVPEENGIDLLPKAGRTYEGLQVYAFGTVSIVMDNAQNLIRAQLGDRWAAVALERLVEEHRTRSARK
ncbi:hypothetical protein WJX72_001760 [[Myrmecia] bisecta]|uniref:G-patch domain-containing protein n=1 Tax=[Myrmecia] bisecta TaxID=41462 RepID=A0AAW1QE86_9CHLO